MNFRKLLTYLTVGTAAVIPFAGAQNPTILQGSYISNVFGNSNFVLNPNAQTNIANVTTVTATVTRSTATPLVATSEFTVAIGTANGTATWATRAFDQGMKGQNCEARFTYRGFAATSKVHIKQGANTVASLNLTPATDPRIASINFPCGDLSNPTTFVVTDTAILAGTNEIGGIYVGLATNMANVAQAEEIGSITYAGTVNCNWTRTGAGSNLIDNFAADADCPTGTVTGAADTTAGKIPGAKFNNLKPGKYMFIVDYTLYKAGSLASNVTSRLSDGTTTSAQLFNSVSSTSDVVMPATSVFTVEYTSMTSPTIQLQGGTANTANSVLIYNGEATNKFKLVAYRFPSSSELVVTPERQNTFAGVVYTSGSQNLFGGSAEPTAYAPFNNATWNQPTLLKGKAAVTTTNSGNDLGFSIPNMPVGNYKLEISGIIGATQNADTGVVTKTSCNFKIVETTTSTDVARQSHQDFSILTSSQEETRDWPNSFFGIYTNVSVATRNFRLEAQKAEDLTAANIGSCQTYAASGTLMTNIAFLLTPLDQPSNSALYVQGPVLGAQTGAAIPEGYVNEFATRSISDTSVRNSSGVTLGTWYYPWTGELTLPAGNWNICYRVAARSAQNRAALSAVQLLTRLENKTDGTSVFENITWPTFDNNTTFIESFLNTHFGCQPISITTSKIFRVGIRANTLLGTPTGVDIAIRGDLVKSELYAIRLN